METLFRIPEIESIILSSNQQPKYICLVCLVWLLNWIIIIQENKGQSVCITSIGKIVEVCLTVKN